MVKNLSIVLFFPKMKGGGCTLWIRFYVLVLDCSDLASNFPRHPFGSQETQPSELFPYPVPAFLTGISEQYSRYEHKRTTQSWTNFFRNFQSQNFTFYGAFLSIFFFNLRSQNQPTYIIYHSISSFKNINGLKWMNLPRIQILKIII